MLLFEYFLEKISEIIDTPDEIEFDYIRQEEIPICIGLRPERSEEELHGRLADGQSCFVARKYGYVVGLVWAKRGTARIDYLNQTFELGTDEYFLYEIVVRSKYRGRRIAASLLSHVYRELQKSGGKRVVFAINLENYTGLRALTRNGARRFALQGFFGFGPWRHHFRREIH